MSPVSSGIIPWPLARANRTKAHLYHWVHSKNASYLTAGILESEKTALENRVRYRYPNQQLGGLREGEG
jgi:hypothetical protein